MSMRIEVRLLLYNFAPLVCMPAGITGSVLPGTEGAQVWEGGSRALETKRRAEQGS